MPPLATSVYTCGVVTYPSCGGPAGGPLGPLKASAGSWDPWAEPSAYGQSVAPSSPVSQAPLAPTPDPPAAWWAPPLPAQSHRLLEPQSACLSSRLTVPSQPTPHLPHRVVVRLQRQARSQKAIIRSEGLYTRQTQDSPASVLSEGEGLLSPRGRVRSWWGEGRGHWPWWKEGWPLLALLPPASVLQGAGCPDRDGGRQRLRRSGGATQELVIRERGHSCAAQGRVCVCQGLSEGPLLCP